VKIIRHDELSEDFFDYKEIEEIGAVQDIISEVRRVGDRAIKKYTLKFDGVELEQFKISTSEIKQAYDLLDNDMIASLELAAANIRRFAIKQREQLTDFDYEILPGVVTGQRVIPIERVGVYTPGGSYPLPSTVLMCCIPARVAGVKEIAVFSPPTYNGSIHPAIVVAADICQVEEIYCIGGVQAIAAMAYGTETIKKVHKIVGPGNQYVAAAKKLVYGVVGIDFIAGPTELMIIADDSANPAFIAADLLAQAEHDVNAIPILITISPVLADRVNQQIEKQLQNLLTADIARQALNKNGAIILVDMIEDAIAIANKKAPEHLELQLKYADAFAEKLKNYGSLFIGSFSAEALGDYSSGLNHTLPTNTCARYTGGLSVKDFVKFQTTLRVTEQGLPSIGSTAVRLGNMEGLHGHARSVEARMKK
jgi:histidinol dehydrogenase